MSPGAAASKHRMRERSDPLVPVLGSAVAVVGLGAAAFIFYPKIARLLEYRRASVIGKPPSPTARIPVWVGHTPDGVALMLEVRRDEGRDRILDEALEGGPYRYLTLTVYNFGRDETFRLRLPGGGLGSAEGGPRARAAAFLLKENVPAHLKAVLRGYGSAEGLEVARGRQGKLLLVIEGDPARRTSFFVNEAIGLERKELERRVLASWQQKPDWEEFKNF